MFNNTREEGFVNRNSIFDKVIIDCAFRENLKKKMPSSDGGCEGFNPSLTTNGMCYTFNGKGTSKLWKPSEITNTFNDLFPLNSSLDKTFGGSGTVQGSYRHLLKYYLNSKSSFGKSLAGAIRVKHKLKSSWN